MLHHVLQRPRVCALILCLLLASSGGALAQDGPDYLPFRSIEGEGSIIENGGDAGFRLSFDADLRLNPQSDGIQPGDDVQIVSSAAYPVPTLQAMQFGLPVNRLVVRLSVVGQCFERRGRALLFRARDAGALAGCAELGVRVFDAAGEIIFDGDFDHVLQQVTIELAPAGRRGRWKLSSLAGFSDPGFPFPVAGYAYDPVGNRIAGVEVIVGDDGGLSPFRTVGFRTLAP